MFSTVNNKTDGLNNGLNNNLSHLTRSEEVGHSRVGELSSLLMMWGPRALPPCSSAILRVLECLHSSHNMASPAPKIQSSQSKKMGRRWSAFTCSFALSFLQSLLFCLIGWNWVPAPDPPKFAHGKGEGIQHDWFWWAGFIPWGPG